MSVDNPSRRLNSFKHWPPRTQVWPQQLSNAGFFYTGKGTNVQCVICGVVSSVDDWCRTDRPEVVHFRISRNCKFIKEHFPQVTSVVENENVHVEERQQMQSKDLLTKPAITMTSLKYKVNGISSELCDGDDNVRLDHGACLPNDKIIFESNIQRRSENSHQSHDLDAAGSTIGPQTSGLVDLTLEDTSCISSQNQQRRLSRMHNGFSSQNAKHDSIATSTPIYQVVKKSAPTPKLRNQITHQCPLYCQTCHEHEVQSSLFDRTMHRGQYQDNIALNVERVEGNKDRKNTIFKNSICGDKTSMNVMLNSQTASCQTINNYPSDLPVTWNGRQSNIHNQSLDVDYPISGVPNVALQSTNEPEFTFPNFRDFQERLASFRTWPSSATQPPYMLAESGYFYTGEGDVVRCFCCNLGLSEWAAADDPWIQHARHFPNCWFLRTQNSQTYINNVQDEWKKIYKPKNPAFDDLASRLATFDGWRDDIEQTPEMLADAGFFFTGEDDVVRCHYCDGGLRNWEVGDLPWEEHARWFPHCKFLIKIKGSQYIDSVKQQNQCQEASANRNTSTEDSESERLLSTVAARTLLRMDIPVNNIKSAINNFIKSNGHTNFTVEELLNVVFELAGNTQFTKENTAADPASLKVINSELKKNLLCVICKTNERCMLFTNCGHRVTCEQCCKGIKGCPHCNKVIKKVVKTFLS